MRKTTSAFVFGLIGILLNLHLAGTARASDQVLNIDKADLWVRVVVADTYNSSYDTERDHYEMQERLNLTVEGTYKYKQYELPAIPQLPDIPGLPPLPSYPRAALLIEDSREFSIAGHGGGTSYHSWLWNECKPGTLSGCRDFEQKGHQSWHYETVDPVYLEDVVRDLKITQQSKDDPVKYKFRLRVVGVGDYIKGSGTGSTTSRGYDRNETSTVPIESYPASFSGGAWDDWLRKSKGDITGELTFQGEEFTGSGHITHSYSATDAGVTRTGTVEIFYKFNPKPSAKKIQVNQALGRYKYVDDQHYVPVSDFAAGKETAVQVFFDKAVPVDELSGVSLEVSRDGSTVATLTDFTRDTENNAVIFRPRDRSECGNWQAGTYKFTAKVKDAEEVLDNVQFQDRRELKVLAVPVRTKFDGVIETPGNEWQSGVKFMRQVYPVAYDKVTWSQGPLFDATGADYDTTTSAGERKLWEELNKMGGAYDLVIGFVQSRIPVKRNGTIRRIQGYAYLDGKASIVVNSDEDMQATVPHEVAHIFKVGDTYDGGGYNLAINCPPYLYEGTILGTDTAVTGPDPEVKPFPGSGTGTLVAKELHPYEMGRGLRDDSMCLMGSGTAQSNYWITPEVWKHLFWSLAPTGSGASAAASGITAFGIAAATEVTALDRFVEASGWVSRSGAVEPSLPWSTTTAAGPADTVTGNYTIQAVDANGAVLGRQGFTPTFVDLSDPPEDLDTAPFTHVIVPFPEGTVKFRIVDQDSVIRSEVPVSAGAPTVAVTAPPAGQEISGPYTITWTATDPDGDSLFYRVEYSSDGRRWSILPPSVTTTSFATDFSLLPGGSQARIRVTASDGIHSASAVSGIFEVPLKETEVTIDSPEADATYRLESGIAFHGSAYDPQEGEIFDDQRLVWTSDRNGEVGRGPSLFVMRQLAAGRHLITLTATNSLGQTASRSVTIHLLPSPPSFNPDGGTFPGPVSVTIADIAEGTTAFYTTDGTDPTTNPGALSYSSAFTVTSSATVKAVVYHRALEVWSSVTARDFVIAGE